MRIAVMRMLCVRAALKFYRKTDDVDSDMEEMDTEDTTGPTAAGDDATAAAKPYTLLQLLRAADLRRPLFIACMLQVIQQFSGINAVSTCTFTARVPLTQLISPISITRLQFATSRSSVFY